MNMRHVRQSTAIAEGIHEGGFKLCNLGAVSFILLESKWFIYVRTVPNNIAQQSNMRKPEM